MKILLILFRCLTVFLAHYFFKSDQWHHFYSFVLKHIKHDRHAISFAVCSTYNEFYLYQVEITCVKHHNYFRHTHVQTLRYFCAWDKMKAKHLPFLLG